MLFIGAGVFLWAVCNTMNVLANAITACTGKQPVIHKMLLLFLMYISQKIFLCFNWTLLPVILRRQEVSLGSIGFTTLVYSPWALKFIHASAIDRFYNNRFGRRKTWIVPLLFISVFILPFLSLLSPVKDITLLLVTVFLLNFIFATIDIAVDGYATDILQVHERPWGNAVQISGYVFGYMMGAGVFLIIYQQYGWQTTLMMITALQLLIMIPVVIHKEMPPVFPEKSRRLISTDSEYGLDSFSFITRPKNLLFILFSGLMVLFHQGGVQLRIPMISDRGISPDFLGRLNIWVGAPMCFIGAVVGGALLKKLGNKKILATGCIVGAGTHFLSAMVSIGLWVDWLGIGIMIGAEKFMNGIISVLIYSMVMNLSAGSRSATRYAILGSLVCLFELGIHPVTGRLCDVTGYFNLYIGLGVFSVMMLFSGPVLLNQMSRLKD